MIKNTLPSKQMVDKAVVLYSEQVYQKQSVKMYSLCKVYKRKINILFLDSRKAYIEEACRKWLFYSVNL